MNDWLWFFPLGGGLWYWWDTLRTREIARAAGRHACDRRQVQFLDDTVVRTRIRLRRNARGHLQLERRYDFEFASDGERRYHGQIDIFGSHVSRIDMEAYRFPAGEDGADGPPDESGGKTNNVTHIP
ncbi:MAG: DUF3301 domain-containing protein [Gammaproteobacteria bacterium]|nr:DUF3301 domain-containing protein [Gammaproteobacteria bacterium]